MTTNYQIHNAHVLNLENEFDIRKELSNIDVDKRAHPLLVQNMHFMHIKLEQIDTRAANLIKKQINKIGGEAAISKDAYSYTERTTDVIVSASKKNLLFLAKKLASQQYGLEMIAREMEKCLENKSGVMQIGTKTFDFNHHTYIMGVLDFHKHLFGSILSDKMILKKAESLIEAGADILDLCGEKLSRYNYDKIDEKEEIDKLIPLIHKIKNNFPQIILSIDTSRFQVAKESLGAGVNLINEVIPLKYNPELINLVSQYQCPVVLMYNPTLNKNPKPLNSISDVIREIQSNVFYAAGNGIQKDKIIIDPGIGFGRSDRDNFLILKQLSSFKHLNYPILVGLSKQSFLGDALKGRMKKTQISSIAANTIAIINGASIIRLHSAEQIEVMRNINETLNKAEEKSLPYVY
ncbi:MAG: dihydropteroate synthase [Spirochaetes bacterium]|nr:dihydropteroate synthase [Spirochaetota bacterium]